MALSRSTVFAFAAGAAAGAVAYATYPRWKDKVAPLISAIISGAAAAAQDAQAASAQPADGAAHAGHESIYEPWLSARNGATSTKAHNV
jgi:hypothetical protein